MQEKTGKREAATLKRRKHIVQAAALCFIDQGFHQTSVRDIAKRANISLGNLYNHFENKTALIAEIAALEAEELAGVAKQLNGTAPPEKRMERFIKAYFKAVSGKENAVLTAEIMAEAMRNPSIAAGYDANRQVLLAALVPLVESLHPGALPALRAELILDMIEGAGLRVAFESRKVQKATRDALLAWIPGPAVAAVQS